jgi:hypothetical protein
MAYIGNDFEFDYNNKRLSHKPSGTAVFTANELYSWAQDTFDELVQMDDKVPMSAQTPTEYSLINGWFMDYESFKYLKTGAIKTIGWDADSYDDGIRHLEFAAGGYVSATSGDIGKDLYGETTGHSGVLVAYDNTLRKWWIRANPSGFFDQAESIYVDTGDGSGVSVGASDTGEQTWANVYTLGTLEAGTNNYIVQSGVKLDSWWMAGHIDVLVLVQEAGQLIDDGYLTIFARQYTKTFDHFEIDVSAGGRNAVPLATAADLNNTTASGTVAGYDDIIIAQVNGELWYDDAGGGGDVGTWAKWVTVSGQDSGATAIVLDDVDYGSSGVLTLGNVQGTFLDNEVVENIDASGAVMGTLDVSVTFEHEDLNNGAGPRPYDIQANLASRPLDEWYEYCKYVAMRASPFVFSQNDGAELYDTDGEQYISAQAAYTPVKASPLGTFAGGNFFGARGVWIENYDSDDAKNFQLIDSSGITQSPPNVVSVKVTSVVAGDRVSVFVLTADSGPIDKEQYTAAAGNNNGDPDFVVQEAIASDTPAAGYFRVVNNGTEDLYKYSSWTGSTFTLDAMTLSRNYTAGDAVFVPLIDVEATGDEVSNTLTYSTDIPVLVRVRKYGILPFEVESDVTSAGMTVAAIRTPDTIVSP